MILYPHHVADDVTILTRQTVRQHYLISELWNLAQAFVSHCLFFSNLRSHFISISVELCRSWADSVLYTGTRPG